MMIVWIEGDKVPSPLALSVAGNNQVDTVHFAWKDDVPSFLGGADRFPFLKLVAGDKILKIPLENNEEDGHPGYRWTVLSSHLPQGGLHLAQLQIEVPNLIADDAFVLWQSKTFQVEASYTLPADAVIEAQEQPVLLDLYARISTLKEAVDQAGDTLHNISETLMTQMEEMQKI